MLMEVRNQIRVFNLSVKYALMREMLNKVTFISNIVFMILNNACFIFQMMVLFSIKEDVGGYSFNDMMILFGLAAGTYGFSRFFFKHAFNLSDTINNGKLDAYLVQPKNVLISSITNEVETAAIGDLIYAYIIFFVFGFTISGLVLYTIFIITGGLILTSVSVIFSSLSFWFSKSDVITDRINSMMISFGTYPDGIFKGIVKIILFTIIPVGMASYLPVKIIREFNINLFLLIILVTILLILISFIIFYKGLKRYSSSNLMVARM